jgi:hypothetical protein
LAARGALEVTGTLALAITIGAVIALSVVTARRAGVAVFTEALILTVIALCAFAASLADALAIDARPFALTAVGARVLATGSETALRAAVASIASETDVAYALASAQECVMAFAVVAAIRKTRVTRHAEMLRCAFVAVFTYEIIGARARTVYLARTAILAGAFRARVVTTFVVAFIAGVAHRAGPARITNADNTALT